ncbi:USP [Symbiodinium natans]|uniref:USP protein n=1 Tax=Symbiodinium natans TaxID=878477 RepID=A0A812G3I0_9DINO|nr:USP [Symbiodinium natans]
MKLLRLHSDQTLLSLAMSTCAGTPLTLQQLQRRFEQLRRFQARLRLPAASYFEAIGRRYRLPLRAEHAEPRKHVSVRVRDYLAGFFDGDGCVQGTGGCVKLSVTQTQSSSSVLLFFRNVLGGGIIRHTATVGLWRPCLMWQVYAQTAQRAAAVLLGSSCCKRSQLAIASQWRQHLRLQACALADLKRLKREEPPPVSCPSWHYLAGFFDAEGSISTRRPAYVRLDIGQKHPQVLQAFEVFLAAQGVHCSIYRDRKNAFHRLTIHRSADCKYVLASLVAAGLRAKRKAARIAMNICKQDFHEVRSKLQAEAGNQGRYRRLSLLGLARAESIRGLQKQLWRFEGPGRGVLESQLEKLQEDHKLRCAEERLQLLRSDIRSLLAAGASSHCVLTSMPAYSVSDATSTYVMSTLRNYKRECSAHTNTTATWGFPERGTPYIPQIL